MFDKARLVVAALSRKIHTIEWTTAILGHPVLQIGMRANWFGLAEERIHRVLGRISRSEIISGIPGSAMQYGTEPGRRTKLLEAAAHVLANQWPVMARSPRLPVELEGRRRRSSGWRQLDSLPAPYFVPATPGAR